MSVDTFYANGRVAVLSTKLLTADKYQRIAEANTVAEAVKVLAESGYGGGSTESGDYEAMLRAELDSVANLLRELASDDNCARYFLAKYDYLNAKVLMKCKYMRTDGVQYCFDCASVAPEEMKKALNADDYEGFTPQMRQALVHIDELFADGDRGPRAVDVTLDKALFAEMESCAKRSKFSRLACYYEMEADCVNLTTLFRSKKAGFSKQAYEKMVVHGGTVKAEDLSRIWDADAEKAVDFVCGDFLKKLVRLLAEDAFKAENFVNSSKIAYLSDNPDATTIAPLLAYYVAKIEEIDKVRFALICIKNDVDKETIKERLKNA